MLQAPLIFHTLIHMDVVDSTHSSSLLDSSEGCQRMWMCVVCKKNVVPEQYGQHKYHVRALYVDLPKEGADEILP